MLSTRLYLVRHGETTWNAEGRLQGQSESSLSARGVAQAMERSAEMQGYQFDVCYCSSSNRARETLQLLLGGDGAPNVNYRDELRELALGSWEGRLLDELEAEQPELFWQYTQQPDQFKLPTAETFQQLQRRGVDTLHHIMRSHQGQRVLVVSHGALIKASLLYWLGRSLTHMWKEPRISNCSCSVLEFSIGEEIRVLSVAGAVCEAAGVGRA